VRRRRTVPAAAVGSSPRLTEDALRFLRALKRNNRRDWFQPRKARYEACVRAPMLSIIERLAIDLRRFAPEIVVDVKSSMYRIYRDTRFSEDKTPYKTHVAASFPWRGLPKHEGAGLYFHIAPTELWVGGGLYAPPTHVLQALREHIAANSRRLRSIVESSSFRRTLGALDGERLQRVPRGFPRDHEAAQFLKYRQFLAGREYAAALAVSSRFYGTLLAVFQEVAPLVRFLNEPLSPRV